MAKKRFKSHLLNSYDVFNKSCHHLSTKKQYKTRMKKNVEEPDIDDCWNNLTLSEKYNFIEDKKWELGIDVDYEEASYDDIEDFWSDMSESDQISFIIEKIQTFFPHNIAFYLSNKITQKEFFVELYKEISKK